MRLAYIYQEGVNIKKANIYQSISMVKAFAEKVEVAYYRGGNQVEGLDNVKQKRVINLGLTQMEKLSRAIFCIHCLLLLKLVVPSVIYTRDFAFIYFYSTLPKWMRLNVPIIFESHKVYSEVSEKVSLSQELKAYSVVTQFVTVSEGIKQDLEELLEVANDRILVAVNGIEKREKVERPKPDPTKEVNFIYAGSYGPWKGVDVILAASLHLPIKNKIGKIYIVGVDETCLPEYRKDLVTILPPMEKNELYAIYDKMDVGLVPTLDLMEGSKYTSPIKLFEYAYAGLLIIASDISSVRELEQKQFKINFFQVGNAESLAERMIAIAENFDKSAIDWNKKIVDRNTWRSRAERILSWI